MTNRCHDYFYHGDWTLNNHLEKKKNDVFYEKSWERAGFLNSLIVHLTIAGENLCERFGGKKWSEKLEEKPFRAS